MWWLLLAGCRAPMVDVSEPPMVEAAPAVLHRLTQTQLDLTLQDLFDDETVPSVSLPAEQPIDGFTNAETQAATPYLVEALWSGVSAVATHVVVDGGTFDPCEADADAACGVDALRQLATRAWRRPLEDAEASWLGETFETWHGEVGMYEALRQGVALVLLSPDFLYLLERGTLDDHERAARLSYLLWDRMPDDALRAAADAGALSTAADVEAQAIRMLDDARSRVAMGRFYAEWLGAAALDPVTWSLEQFAPSLDPESFAFYQAWQEDGALVDLSEAEMRWRFTQTRLKEAMRHEVDVVVDEVRRGTGTLEELLTTSVGVPHDGLDVLYGVPESIAPRALDPIERPGILTRAAVLAAHSGPEQPSPVLRGAFLTERLRCRPPEPAPATVPALEEASAGAVWTTNRERYEAALAPGACAGCHASFTPVGYTLEGYDAMGRWRIEDAGVPVDSVAEVDGLGTLADGVELMQALAASREVHDCVATQFFRFAARRTEHDADAEVLNTMRERLWTHGGHLREMVLAYVTSPAFLTRAEEAE